MINAGVYIIDPELLGFIKPEVFTDMPSLILEAKKRDLIVTVCPINEYWIDVGRPETLEKAIEEWPPEF